MPFAFDILARSGAARRARISTAHGPVETPVFMPVGTQATVKAISQDILEELGAQIILANTYHLYLRPGAEQIRALGGLHRFMSWDRAILTDSGGFQVWSLSQMRKVSDQGVEFRSHLDGSPHVFTPESATASQIALGADIIMAFDECTEYPAERERACQSMELTVRWAEQCKRFPFGEEQALLGIVQGSMYPALREESARALVSIGFDGYAIGGLSLGESRGLKSEMIDAAVANLPEDSLHYLMGVGRPEEITAAVAQGIDLFDCVLPTRNARNGSLFTSQGTVVIKQSRYREDPEPVDPECDCYVCKNFSRAYLRHLFMAREINSAVLNTYHNVYFYLKWMRRIRESIANDNFSDWMEKQ